jgi:head-tail adaptor
MKCSLVTKSGSTRLFAQAKDMPVSHKLQTRYFADWQPANANKRRFKFGNRIFKIVFVNNIEENNRFLEYTITENTPT